MDSFLLGQIILFAGNYAPQDWAFCSGQLLPISQNQALYSLLGTTYGGNGSTTFALPDLRGRVPLHRGQGPGLSDYRLGQAGGSETNTLTLSNLPAHNHTAAVAVTGAEGTTDNPVGNILAKPHTIIDRTTTAVTNAYAAPSSTPSGSMGTGQTVTVGLTGLGQSFNNMQPYLGLNYIICMQGIYPPRP